MHVRKFKSKKTGWAPIPLTLMRLEAGHGTIAGQQWLRAMGKWQFEREEFEKVYASQRTGAVLTASEVLEKLYEFSFIGFYRAGGRGFGGSEYMFKYREPHTRFDPTATRFRIHPGLIEVMGLKRA